jgi:hypothetical protein
VQGFGGGGEGGGRRGSVAILANVLGGQREDEERCYQGLGGFVEGLIACSMQKQGTSDLRISIIVRVFAVCK